MLEILHKTDPVAAPSGRASPRPEGAGAGAAALVVAVVGAGAFVRFYGLGWQSLWFDEAFSWRIVRFPWAEVARRTADDVHPPLYYFALKAWVGLFGDSAVAMRSLSAVTDLLMLPLLYGFVTDLYRPGGRGSGRRVALLSMALAALCVSRVVLAREARMYPLGCLLAVASSWMLWKSLYSRGGRLGSWVAYVASAVGLCYTHNYGLFTVAAQAAFAFGVAARDRSRPGRGSTAGLAEVSAAFVAVALGFAPWLPVLLRQRGRVAEGYWISGLDWYTFHGLFEQLFTPDRHLRRSAAGGAATLAFAAVTAAYGWRPMAARVYVLLLVLTPLALGLGVSLAQGQSVILGIYLAFALPFFLVAVADLVERIPSAPARTAVAALLVANLAAQDGYYWREADVAGRPGLRRAVGFVRERFRPGDLVLSLEAPTMLAASPYFGPSIKPVYLTDGDPDRRLMGEAVYLDSDRTSADDLRRNPPRRIWVIAGTVLHRRRMLPEGWRAEDRWTFPDAAPRRRDADVWLFGRADRSR